MSERRPRRVLLAVAGAGLLFLATPRASAQEPENGVAEQSAAPQSAPQQSDPLPLPEQSAPARTPQEYRELLLARNRNRMHPGDPLLINGVDQGDNDMRKNTPILEQSDKVVMLVDESEAYQRALSLYGAGATFKTALSSASDSVVASAPKHAPRNAPKPAPIEGGAQWPWLVASAICVAFLVWLGRRFAEPSAKQRAA